MAWRDTRGAAAHLDVSEARFLAMVKDGKLPKPSYHLGERSPRWSLEALDSAMGGTPASDVTREAFSGLVKKIEEEGRARRQGKAA